MHGSLANFADCVFSAASAGVAFDLPDTDNMAISAANWCEVALRRIDLSAWKRARRTNAGVHTSMGSTASASGYPLSLRGDAVTKDHRRVLLVGIAGPSGSGKSTLADKLAIELESPVRPIRLDGYFMLDKMPIDPRFGKNWETPAGVNFASLHKDLQNVVRTLTVVDAVPESIIVSAHPCRGGGNIVRQGWKGAELDRGSPLVVLTEGFLLFQDPLVSSIIDSYVWTEAECEVCSRRRYNRDAYRGAYERFAQWYEELVWSHFLEYRPAQLANAPSALHLDGTQSVDALVQRCAAHCRQQLALPPERQHEITSGFGAGFE